MRCAPRSPILPTAALRAALLLAALAVPAAAQVYTVGTGTVVNTTTSYPAPYGNFYWGARHQFLVPAAELAAAGMTAGPITAVAFDVVTVAGQPLQGLSISMGQTAATVLTAWQTGLIPLYGPQAAYQPVAGWNTHNFCGSFPWDGVSNLVVETCHNNTSYTNNCVLNQTALTYVASYWYRADQAGVCGNAATSGNSVNRPNMRFTMAPPPPVNYQVNQPAAALTINGAVGSACAPTVVNQTVFTLPVVAPVSGTIALSTNQAGMPWDILVSPAVLVPATAGGQTLSDGQIINLDFAAPVSFVNGFLATPFPGYGIPGLTSATLSVTYAIQAQTDVALQAVVVNPAAASGLSLSQGSELHVAVLPALPSVPGPVSATSSTSVAINVTAAPTCWVPGGLTFFGTNYSTIQVSSEGRITFGLAANDNTAAVADALTGPPFVGFWTDLDPVTGGASVTVANLAPGIIRVSYNSCRYAGDAVGPTFAIQIDGNSGVITVDGLAGIPANPQAGTLTAADAQFLGISKGSLGATNGTMTTFAPASAGSAPNATAMIYDFYTQYAGGPGRCNSLAAGGLNGISFIPSAAFPTNYDWIGY